MELSSCTQRCVVVVDALGTQCPQKFGVELLIPLHALPEPAACRDLLSLPGIVIDAARVIF